jgi:hypothetical protein
MLLLEDDAGDVSFEFTYTFEKFRLCRIPRRNVSRVIEDLMET